MSPDLALAKQGRIRIAQSGKRVTMIEAILASTDSQKIIVTRD